MAGGQQSHLTKLKDDLAVNIPKLMSVHFHFVFWRVKIWNNGSYIDNHFMNY